MENQFATPKMASQVEGQASLQMKSASPPGLQLKTSEPGASSGGSAGAPVQRKTTIVDDKSDATNTLAPGTGRGLLAHSDGSVNESVMFGGLNNDCGTIMSASIIPSAFSGGIDDAGTVPQAGSWPNWWAANAPKPNNYWVRGHLLNHNVGGPGEKRNLTPITKKANSEHHNTVEKAIKVANENGAGLIDYQVTAVYDGKGPQKLKKDATNPNPACWPMLTTGFQCEYYLRSGDDGSTLASLKCFIENTH